MKRFRDEREKSEEKKVKIFVRDDLVNRINFSKRRKNFTDLVFEEIFRREKLFEPSDCTIEDPVELLSITDEYRQTLKKIVRREKMFYSFFWQNEIFSARNFWRSDARRLSFVGRFNRFQLELDSAFWWSRRRLDSDARLSIFGRFSKRNSRFRVFSLRRAIFHFSSSGFRSDFIENPRYGKSSNELFLFSAVRWFLRFSSGFSLSEVTKRKLNEREPIEIRTSNPSMNILPVSFDCLRVWSSVDHRR